MGRYVPACLCETKIEQTNMFLGIRLDDGLASTHSMHAGCCSNVQEGILKHRAYAWSAACQSALVACTLGMLV